MYTTSIIVHDSISVLNQIQYQDRFLVHLSMGNSGRKMLLCCLLYFVDNFSPYVNGGHLNKALYTQLCFMGKQCTLRHGIYIPTEVDIIVLPHLLVQVFESTAYFEMLRDAPELGQRFTRRAAYLAFSPAASQHPQSSAGPSEVTSNQEISHTGYF